MAFRLYLIPIIGTGAEHDGRRPKYLTDGTVTGDWGGMDYGNEPWMIVGTNLSPVDEAVLLSQPDVFALPVDLSPKLTAPEVAAVQAQLEAMHLPAGWITPALTWREMVRTVLKIVALMQRLQFYQENTRLFENGVTLDTPVNALSPAVVTQLRAAVSSLRLNPAGVAGAVPLRQMLKTLADQAKTPAFVLHGVRI